MIQGPELTGVTMSNLFWLTDAQMARLRPFFPRSHGAPRVDDRRVLSGIIFINRNGLRWCDAPRVNGGVKSCHRAAQNQATLDLGMTRATRRRPVSRAPQIAGG